MGMLLELLGLRSPTVTTTKVATVAGPTVAQGTPPQAITPPVAVGAITKEQHDYDTDRAAVQVLITELNGHAQTARIATEIAQIVAKMGVAATHAGKAEWVDAMRVLGEARTACVAAKTLAEGWADYAKKRASMKYGSL